MKVPVVTITCRTSESAVRVGYLQDSEVCHRCAGENVIWVAPSPLWNLVMRDNDINGEPLHGDLVCVRCFIVLAAEKGVQGRWRITVDPEPDGLLLTTPSGRTWDAECWQWIDATPENEPLPEAASLRERIVAAFYDGPCGDYGWLGRPEAEMFADRAIAMLEEPDPAPQGALLSTDALANWLGAMPESHNVFDITDEATTVITIDVETLADRIAEPIRTEVVAAEQHGREDNADHGQCYVSGSAALAAREHAAAKQALRQFRDDVLRHFTKTYITLGGRHVRARWVLDRLTERIDGTDDWLAADPAGEVTG